MTSSTDLTPRTDPFPTLGDLVAPGSGAHGALDELRMRAESEGRRAGFEAGRLEGFEQGLVEGRALIGERTDAVLGSIAAAVAGSRADEAAVTASLGRAVVDVALEVARAVIGRELELATSPGRDALVRALTEAPTAGQLVARLHPADAELLGAGGPLQRHGTAEIELVADERVEPGGCLLDTSTGQVDALLSSTLDRVAEALRGTATDDDLGRGAGER